jgi:flagellar hook-basal body complex protein FliE
MSIEALGGVSPVGMLGALTGATGVSPTAASTQVGGVAGSSAAFGTSLAGSIDDLQALQSNSQSLAVAAVTGDLDDIHDYTIASTQAAVTLELTAAVRNKAVEAFNEIMRMQA